MNGFFLISLLKCSQYVQKICTETCPLLKGFLRHYLCVDRGPRFHAATEGMREKFAAHGCGWRIAPSSTLPNPQLNMMYSKGLRYGWLPLSDLTVETWWKLDTHIIDSRCNHLFFTVRLKLNHHYATVKHSQPERKTNNNVLASTEKPQVQQW